MSGIVRTAVRMPVIKNFINPLMNRPLVPVKRDFTRSIWHMSAGTQSPIVISPSLLNKNSMLCSCGCGIKGLHTKEFKNSVSISPTTPGERELVEFLTEEILAERKAQKVKSIPTELDGFAVKLNGAEVTMSKKVNDDLISISFNVNHTVDSEPSEEEPTQDKEDFSEMRSKPQFEVDIQKDNTTLSFTCSFIQDSQSAQEDDVFGIDEITMYQGEWNDKIYAVAGDVLDGYLYDLLMNILEEKGISNEFAEKLSDYSTAYEHSAYIGLLEGLSKFTTGKK